MNRKRLDQDIGIILMLQEEPLEERLQEIRKRAKQKKLEKHLVELGSTDLEERKRAAEILGEMGDVSAVGALIDALDDDEWEVRREAAKALGKIGDALAVPALIELLDDGTSFRVQTEVAETLGKIRDVRAIPILKEALCNTAESVRLSAAVALDKIGDPSVLPTKSDQDSPPSVSRLREALRNRDEKGCRRIIYQLGKSGDVAAVPTLIEVLKDQKKSMTVRFKAASTLGRIGDVSALPVLKESLLADPAGRVRLKAAIALGTMGDASVVPLLIEALRDEKPSVCVHAIVALGKIDDRSESTVSALKEMLRHTDPHVQLQAHIALGKMGDASIQSLLEEQLMKKDRNIYESAAYALGMIANQTNISKLRDTLVSELRRFLSTGYVSEQLRSWMARMLQEIGSPTPV